MRRVVACTLVAVTPLAACGSDSGSDSESSTGLGEEDQAIVEELQEFETDDREGVDEELLEEISERGEAAVEAAVAFDLAPCDVVTVEEIEAVTGFAVELVSDMPPISCRFDLVVDSDLYIVTTVDDGEGRLAGAATDFLFHEDEGGASPFEPVGGVGERALFSGRGISVDAGDGRYFSIGVGGQFLELAEPREEMIALAESALARL